MIWIYKQPISIFVIWELMGSQIKDIQVGFNCPLKQPYSHFYPFS